MAFTVVKTKDGKEYEGAIKLFRPSFNFFTLFNHKDKFSFDDCESIITHGERVSINSPVEGEDCDEMLRAKEDLDVGRKHGWVEIDDRGDAIPYPKKKFDWEESYENT